MPAEGEAPLIILALCLCCLAPRPAIGQYVSPTFASSPSPIVYATPGRTTLVACNVTGDSVLQCGVADGGNADFEWKAVDTVVAAGIRCVKGGLAVDASSVDAAELPRRRFQCKAVSKSRFGLLGRPFKIIVPDIRPYNERIRITEQQCFKGNKVQIECTPPQSDPPAVVTFTVDGVPLSPHERFRIVQLATGNAALVINKVFNSDGDKVYGCKFTNPLTGRSVNSPSSVRLKVNEVGLRGGSGVVAETFAPRVVYPPRPSELTILEGSNATFTCITESSPVSTVSFLRNRGDPLPPSARELKEFGILHFVNIRYEDAGSYACCVTYRSSFYSRDARDTHSLHNFTVVVRKRLAIALPPYDIMLANRHATVDFICRVEGHVSQHPVWFNNGRRVQSGQFDSGLLVQDSLSDPKTTRLLVRRFDDSMRGIVQCVAYDVDGGQWINATAHLLLAGETVKKDFETPAATLAPAPALPELPPPGFSRRLTHQPEAERLRGDQRCVHNLTAVQVHENMAVNVSWYVIPSLVKYMRHLLLDVKENGRSLNEDINRLFGNSPLEREGFNNLVWTRPKPGQDYRFELSCRLSNSNSSSTQSSNVVSFAHVTVSKPSVDKVPTNSNQPLRWNFRPGSADLRVTSYEIFVREVDSTRRGYRIYKVRQGNATQYFFYDLKPNTRYELLMFARMLNLHTGEKKRSSFSSRVTMQLKPLPPSKNTSRSVGIMYIALGCLGVLTLLVIAGVVCVCAYRTRTDKGRRRRQPNEAWSNTFTYAPQTGTGCVSGTGMASYKDPAKVINRASLSRHNSLQAGGNSHNNFSLSLLHGQQQQQQQQQQMYHGGAAYPAEQTSMLMDYYSQQHLAQQQQQQQQPSPYQVYQQHQPYQQHQQGTLSKREPPSGGSIHDSEPDEFDQNETLYYRGAYPQNHHQAQHPYLQMPPQAAQSHYQQHQHPHQHPHYQTHGSFGYNDTAQRLGIQLHPAGDNESLYSYFSQHDIYAQTPGQHGSSLNMVDGGTQTQRHASGLQPHRHHRRKRRRQNRPGVSGLEEAPAQPPTPPVMRDTSTNTDFVEEEEEEAEAVGSGGGFNDSAQQPTGGIERELTPPPVPQHHQQNHLHHLGGIYERPEDVVGVAHPHVNGRATSSTASGLASSSVGSAGNSQQQLASQQQQQQQQQQQHREGTPSRHSMSTATATAGTGTGTGTPPPPPYATNSSSSSSSTTAAAAAAAAASANPASSSSLHRQAGGGGGGGRFNNPNASASSASLPRGRAFSPQPHQHQHPHQHPHQQPPSVPKMRSITDYAIPSAQQQQQHLHHHHHHHQLEPDASPQQQQQQQQFNQSSMPYQQHQYRGDYPV